MEIKKGFSYIATHIPSGESWFVLGIDVKGDRVCAAGWPPSTGKLSDCKDIEVNTPMNKGQIDYREKQFGTNWDN
jgi:hypothetical protein